MNKQVDMIAFAGKDFDCEFAGNNFNHGSVLGSLSMLEDGYIYHCNEDPEEEFQICRPRLNKAQVLDDWSWVPDGLVFEIDYTQHIESIFSGHHSIMRHKKAYPSSYLRILSSSSTNEVHSASCIGVEPDYEPWGKERGMPVVTL